MIMTRMEEEKKKLEFVKRAAHCFAQEEQIATYTENGKIEGGNLFAMRWGREGDCIVVFKIDPTFEPINYQNVLKVKYGTY